MTRATLMKHGKELWPKLGRIVFIGTPHYGSPSIAGYLKNHLWGFELIALLGKYLSRDTFRSLWGVLGMMPAPRGIYPGTRQNDPAPWRSAQPADPYVHPCANFDMYQADNWKLGLTEPLESQLQNVLAGAADFHKNLYDAHQALGQDLRNRMLVIAGVGYKTLFRLAYEERFFGLWERMDKVTNRVKNDDHREGDGRVPVASAKLENVAIRYVKGVHGGLPNLPPVYNDVFQWLNGKSLSLPKTIKEALSQHLGPAAGQSEAPHLDGTNRVPLLTDDPGLWDLTMPVQTQLQALDLKLEQGEVPEFITVRLL